MLADKISKQDILFAHTYFLTLALTAFIVVFNLFYGRSMVFYIPFAVGGGGSFVLYVLLNHIKRHARDIKIKSKIICHACCSAIYIIGAFILLVFYNLDFVVAWSYHIWIVSILMVAALRFKHNAFIFALLVGIFLILFVLETIGLLGAAVWAMAIGGFWGFSFYFLLGFWSDIKEIFNLQEVPE
ncbi:MAG: hypothetical protein FWF78_06765 [Defluviitaleaceae bacterium]|nr:hypothetical protein [Defluviitaleaceae bacterium]